MIKGKVVPINIMNAYGGSWDIAPINHNRGAKWRWAIFMPWPPHFQRRAPTKGWAPKLAWE